MRQYEAVIKRQLKMLFLLALAGLLLSIATACRRDRLETTVKAELWFVEQAPAEHCGPDSPLLGLGIYRVVSCAKAPNAEMCKTADTYEEFISVCSPAIKNYLAAHKDTVKDWLVKAKQGAR